MHTDSHTQIALPSDSDSRTHTHAHTYRKSDVTESYTRGAEIHPERQIHTQIHTHNKKDTLVLTEMHIHRAHSHAHTLMYNQS